MIRRALFLSFLTGLQIPADYYVSLLTRCSKFRTENFHGRIGS